jgi:phosphoglycolate phosphatase-like HAD superfamily hydrolase
MNLFFDLDGTLLNSQMRLYRLFQDLVGASYLSIHEYWELKRNKINHKTILSDMFHYTDDDFNHFEKSWMEKIELPEYLQFDALVDDVPGVLNFLAQKNDIYIVTSRQSKENAIEQLKRLQIYNFFYDVLVTEHKYEKVVLVKKKGYKKGDFLIGDTGKDVLTGLELSMNTIAVTYGFLKKDILETYKPHFVVDKLSDIIDIV